MFVLLCALVAAFVFVLSFARFSSCGILVLQFRLSFCSMVFTIIHSQLGYVSGEGDKKKVRTRRDGKKEVERG